MENLYSQYTTTDYMSGKIYSMIDYYVKYTVIVL